MNSKILYVLPLILYLSLVVYCNEESNDKADNNTNNTVLNKIKTLENELLHAKTKEAEHDVLFKIWEMSYIKHEVGMGISAVDEENNQVIQNLSKAKGEVTVTITLSGRSDTPGETDGWFYEIKFIPIAIDNIYVLLME
ncbi:MAG: hypothetical protein JW822_13760 [Spirochaetales bacterium]|nr:hypothetical protein [Spirochaetales bacterium]